MRGGNQSRVASSGRAAFTLIELLVVMLIVVILTGMTLGVAKYVSWRARQAKIGMDKMAIESALEEYRAVYGEYPITRGPDGKPDSNHYFDDFEIDPGTSQNVPEDAGRRVWLVSSGLVETLPFTIGFRFGGAGSIKIDHSLTFPLKIRPMREGRPAFMDFPKITVCGLAWRNAQNPSYIGTNWYSTTEYRTYLMGDPVNRYMALHPDTGQKWYYACEDGTTYRLEKRPLD